MTPDQTLRFIREVNALERVPRAGYVLRGVKPPESVAAHTLGVLAAAFAVAERIDAAVDRGRLALMALLHDLAEARVGDVPMPEKGPEDVAREDEAMAEILEGLPARFRDAWDDYRALGSLEARIVHGCDKVQLMAKVLAYEAEGRGDVSEFWENPGNFRDGDLPEIREVYEEIRRVRG
jgi:putative hydrolase of HD superfamily